MIIRYGNIRSRFEGHESECRSILIGQGPEGTETLFDRRNRFPSGLLFWLTEQLKRQGITGVIHNIPEFTAYQPPSNKLGRRKLRDYQVESIQRMLHFKRGIIEIGTGGGKTEIYLGFLTSRPNDKSLFIVPSDDSRSQLCQRARGVGIEILPMSKRKEAQHYVTTPQFMIRGLHNEWVQEQMDQIGILCFDECHHLGTSQTWIDVAENCPANYRFGLSATPYTDPRDPYRRIEDLRLTGYTGPPIISLPAHWLQLRGVTETPVVFHLMYPTVPMGDVPDNNWMILRSVGIVGNYWRNQTLGRLLRFLIQEGRRPLMLVELIRHAKKMGKWVSDGGPTLAVCKGDRETYLASGGELITSTRQEALSLFSEDKVQGFIATSVFDEAVDMPDITDLILAGGGKGGKGKYVKTIQRVGRATRKSGSDLQVQVWLPHDLNHPVLRYHSMCQRRALEEHGFYVIDAKAECNDREDIQVFTRNTGRDGGVAFPVAGSPSQAAW